MQIIFRNSCLQSSELHVIVFCRISITLYPFEEAKIEIWLKNQWFSSTSTISTFFFFWRLSLVLKFLMWHTVLSIMQCYECLNIDLGVLIFWRVVKHHTLLQVKCQSNPRGKMSIAGTCINCESVVFHNTTLNFPCKDMTYIHSECMTFHTCNKSIAHLLQEYLQVNIHKVFY